jgi:hypothetical protein
MTRLYELLNPDRGNASPQPAHALREARTWLRHLTTHQAEQYIQGHPCLAQAINLRPSASATRDVPRLGGREKRGAELSPRSPPGPLSPAPG